MNADIARMVETIFSTQWALVQSPPAVKYRNVSFTQPDNGEWVTLTIQPGSGTQASIGDQPIERQFGILNFQIFTKKDIGDRRAKKIADMIAGVFRYKTFALDSGGAISTFANGTVLTLEEAGLLTTEGGAILTTESGVGLLLEGGNQQTVCTMAMLFRSPVPYDVGERAAYYQLGMTIPYQADKLFT